LSTRAASASYGDDRRLEILHLDKEIGVKYIGLQKAYYCRSTLMQKRRSLACHTANPVMMMCVIRDLGQMDSVSILEVYEEENQNSRDP